MRRPCLFIIILIAASATAQLHAERGFQLLSRSLLQGPARAIAFYQDGFVLCSGGGIAVFSPAESLGTPRIHLVNGQPYQIAIRNRTAYVAANRGGLVTIDLSDPLKPVETETYRISRAILCCLSERYLFCADYEGGVYTFTLTNPLRPRLIHEKRLFPLPLFMESAGEHLAVVSTREARIFGIGNSGKLTELTRVQSPENLRKCLLNDGELVLLSTEGTVFRWDVTDPAEPKQLSAIENKMVLDVTLDEGRGFILTNSHEIMPFESVGRAPKEHPPGWTVQEGKNSGSNTGTVPGDTIVFGKPLELKYENSDDGSGRFDNLVYKMKGKLNPGTYIGRSLFLEGKAIVTTAGLKGLSLFRLEEEKLLLIGTVPTGGFAMDLIAAGDLLYLANGNDGVRIGRIFHNGSVDWIGHLPSYHARDVALNGDILVLADGEDGLKTVDVSDPRRPAVVGHHRSSYFMSAVVSDGTFAYVAGGKGGAEIIDVSNPKRPELVWRREYSEMRGIDIDSRYCYIADGNDGFRTFSILNGKPTLISTIDTPGWNCDVFIVGDTAYLADGGKGIRIVDINDRTKPRKLGAVNLNTLVREIHVVDGTLFAAGHTAGIIAVDVTDPNTPRVASTFRTVDDARGVFADDSFVYLASGSGGLYIFKYKR